MTQLEDETINDAKMGEGFKKFYMTNAFREEYKDKQEIVANNTNVNANIDNLTVDEAKNILDELSKKIEKDS